jgi:hypothetical protein
MTIKELAHDDRGGRDFEKVLVEGSDFRVRLADNHGRRNKSSMLINRRYSWRGYKNEPGSDLSPAANHITLQACRGDAVFGTLSLAFDSPSGLAADTLYKVEIDRYRGPVSRVCELTRLAIDPEHGSKEVLGALFHLAYIFGDLLGPATDVFIEVNPRHVVFYKRMLHFRQVGERRMCPRVNAPAVLLHLDVAHVTDQIARYGGTRDPTQRSLYPYFFSKLEQEGLEQRIARLPS